jgi:hypothetical protein
MKNGLLALLLCGLLVATTIPGTHAQPQTQAASLVTGSFAGGSKDSSGTSNYTVLYSYPAVVTKATGSNFTLQLTLLVDSLTGLRLNVYTFGYAVTVFWTTGPVLMGHYQWYGTNYLYPGSHSPVANITIPMNDSSVGVTPGQTTMGTITVNTDIEVYYGQPVNFYFPDAFMATIGNVTYSDAPATTSAATTASPTGATSVGQGLPSSDTLLIAAAVGVVVVVAVGSYVLRRNRGPPAPQAPTPT